MTPSLEGWPTKAKEEPSPHEVRLTPLDTNPDAPKETNFKDISNFNQSNFNLLTNSGKIKSELRIASEAQGIQHYSLPKIRGIQFIGHR